MIWAKTQNGAVWDVVVAEVSDEKDPSFGWTDVTNYPIRPVIGWTTTDNINFTDPATGSSFGPNGQV